MSRIDLKVVLLGKEYGGKTSLVERFIYDRFRGEQPYQNTIGAAFGAKRLEVNGHQITLGLWDTAGSERYESMSRIYYRDAAAAVVCFDLTDETSYARVAFWVNELNKNEENCKIYLCGTKNDLVKENHKSQKVDYHTVTDYADEINAEFFKTSSKTGEGVYELFNRIAIDYGSHNRKTLDGVDKLSLEVSPCNKKQVCCTSFGH